MTGAPPTKAVPAEVLEVYKLAVEMADRLSARRNQANQFFLTLTTAVTGTPSVLAALSTPSEKVSKVPSAALALTGIVICAMWWLLLRSYRALGQAKFEVMHSLENNHFQARIYQDEWEILQRSSAKSARRKHIELGTVERLVPFVLAIINLATCLWIVL